MADDEADKGYTWETEYERTWEALREDEDGSLQAAVDSVVHQAKRRKLLEKPINVRLGMMRHLYIIIDLSKAMEDQDLKPTRLISTLKLLEYFVDEYFDQNPISQLGVLLTRNKRAEKVTELGGNPKRHISSLKALKDKECQGEPSLQNVLELAMSALKNMPSHASRELLILFGSLTSCDPSDIGETITELKKHNIRCSVIGLAAEVHVCKRLCQQTHGRYNVIMDEAHYRDLLTVHLSPPAAAGSSESSLIRMGFPHHKLDKNAAQQMPSLCMCHLDSKSGPGMSTTGYFCPQCKSKYCELPVECKVCGLTLVSAPHLARSYHHLFPLQSFTDYPTNKIREDERYCFSCQKNVPDQNMYQCPKCGKAFCIDCDIFIHETLHCCPGCASSRATQQVTF